MTTVVIPLDGSELSVRALSLGEVLAAAVGGSIELVYVLEEPFSTELLPDRADADRDAAQRYLASVAARASGHVPISTQVLRGQVADELLTLAEAVSPAIIVMTTHGRGGLGRILFGSVSDKVLRGATVPVAIVRHDAPAPASRLSNVVVPLDGSPLAEAAIEEATTLARATDATIHLIRVIEPVWRSTYMAYAPEAAYLSAEYVAEVEAQLEAEARAYLDRVAQQLREGGLRVTWEVRSGRPCDEIARTAETIGAELIVMSTHGRGGIRRWALGSVTSELLHRSLTPVLIVPPGAHTTEDTAATELTATRK